jgi:hypothetical protein
MGDESEAAWRGMLDDLIARGLRTPHLPIIDGVAGAGACTGGVGARRADAATLHDEVTADSLEEAGDRLFSFTRLPTNQWKSSLFRALLASGQISMRKAGGSPSHAEKPTKQTTIGLASWPDHHQNAGHLVLAFPTQLTTAPGIGQPRSIDARPRRSEQSGRIARETSSPPHADQCAPALAVMVQRHGGMTDDERQCQRREREMEAPEPGEPYGIGPDDVRDGNHAQEQGGDVHRRRGGHQVSHNGYQENQTE